MSVELAKETTTAALATVREEIAHLHDWKIEGEDDMQFAGDMLADVKGRMKRLEAQRTKITKPMNAAKKAVDELFKTPRTALEEAERLLKGKIAGYLEAAAEDNDEAYIEAAEAETVEEATAALATVRDVAAPKGVSVRYTYKPRIVNEGMVMPEFCSPDMGKIKAYMRENKNDDGSPSPIPGVIFDREPIVASRSA